MDVAHKQTVAILLRKCVRQIETCPAMSRQVGVIANCLDVVVDIWVHVRTTLLVINTSLHDVKQMRNHTARGESLTAIVKIETPWIRQSAGKNLKRAACRVVPPDTTVNELSCRIVVARFPHLRLREYSVAAVEPAVRPPK